MTRNDLYLFGTGAKTFEFLYYFELENPNSDWESWAHNDYLEIILNFGLIGCTFLGILIISIFLMALQITCSKTNLLVLYILCSNLGVLIHALADFPLQIPSITLLLVILNSYIMAKYQSLS